MVTSCADHGIPKNAVVEDRVAFETWPDTATEVFFVPSHVNRTSLVPPVGGSVTVPSSMVKLLFVVDTAAKLIVAVIPIHRINAAEIKNNFLMQKLISSLLIIIPSLENIADFT